MRARIAELSAADKEALLLRLLALAERGPAVLYAAQAGGDFAATYVSPSCTAMVGYSPEEFTSQPTLWSDGLHPDDAAAVFAAHENLLESGRLILQYRFRCKNGSYRWMRDELIVVKSPDGISQEVLGYWIDVTDKVTTEAQVRELTTLLEQRVAERTQVLETLLKEVHHRVKNNLQVVTSLLRLYSEESTDLTVRDAFRQTSSRVRAMSIVHELLYRSDDLRAVSLGEYLAELVAQLNKSHGRGPAPALGGQVSIEVEAVAAMATLEDAVPIGLLVTELVSNALKHAFPAGRHGRIGIQLTAEATGAGEERGCLLVVRDDGVGETASTVPAHGPQLGLRLVQSLARQLRGTVGTVHGPGTTVSIAMKLKDV